jgi:HPt (histidine-containing phosphotransfer) domain-containing protein
MHGSSRMVGATHLAMACGAIEMAAKDGQMEKAAAGRSALDDAIERLRKQLASARTQKAVQ